ncbi:MAG: asparagine synthase (glutamine-hydrolyzing) [Lentisphaerae bacterium]|nr:asparagine synthase (glutamine-hydrolyzing) [Lentisphaerota bacterium]
MCGIAGVFAPDKPELIAPARLARMIAALRHRGPDQCGMYLDDAAGLAHARLSIIDLRGGAQPIHNEDETLWITYNGEIFNYVELRAELVERGHRFYTTSDTEVLVHLFEDLGPRCLERLNGEFAFALWDARRRSLFLARDRPGIRPLYYCATGGALLFASEAKAIFTQAEARREIDPAALHQVFTFWTTLPGASMFAGVRELPPGHAMTVDASGARVARYWDVPFVPPEEQTAAAPGALREEALRLLQDAVRIRLRADVPVGSYVSGGLDSSGVTALVVRNKGRDVTTFGIRFAETAFDEGDHQRRAAAFLGTRHTEMPATNAAIAAALPDVVWHAEKALLRTAPVPLYLLSRRVREAGLKVVLTGEGADEVFGGYNIFREAKVRRFWARRPGSRARPRLLEKLYPYVFRDPRARATLGAFFGRGLDRPDDPLFSHIVRWENTARLKTFFSDAVRGAADTAADYAAVRASLPAGFDRWDYLAKAQYLEMMVFLGSYLLSSQGDRVAMAHAVEIRLPYLDCRLVELMSRVPPQWKIRGLNEKYLLKKVFEGILPPEIARREKQPYRAPIKAALLTPPAAERTLDALSGAALRRAGIFDERKVARLLAKLQNASEPGEFDNMALVGILTTQLLYERFVEGWRAPDGAQVKPDLMIDRRAGASGEGGRPRLPPARQRRVPETSDDGIRSCSGA